MSDMPHKFEVQVQEYLAKLSAGEAPPVDDVLIDQACEEFRAALKKQFTESRSKEFTVRMSNAGRAKCQLWWQKNHPDQGQPMSYDFAMKMLLGDAIEVLALLIMRASGITIDSYHGKVTLPLRDEGSFINGEYDVIIDDKVWDIKSASPFAFEHKFKDFQSLQRSDSFGYLAQGYGYAKASGKDLGGWIVINKSTGQWKFVEAPPNNPIYVDVIQATHDYIATDKPLFREYEPVEETYRKKPTGNWHIPMECSFCEYKFPCWGDLKYRRCEASQAKNKPWRYYTKYVEPEETNNT